MDPTELSSGFHFGQVFAYDSSCSRDHGPLFKVPVTIAKPVNCTSLASSTFSIKDLTLSSGDINRTFISVPVGCNFLEFTVKTNPQPISSLFQVLFTQLPNVLLFNIAS